MLDEPTSGLDPDVALRVRDLIRQLADQGIAILLTSHSMPEVEELADTISVIGAGKVVTTGTVEKIASFAGISKITRFSAPAQYSDIANLLAAKLPQHVAVRQRPVSAHWDVTIYWGIKEREPDAQLDFLRSVLNEFGMDYPSDILTRPASLEEAYLALADRLAR